MKATAAVYPKWFCLLPCLDHPRVQLRNLVCRIVQEYMVKRDNIGVELVSEGGIYFVPDGVHMQYVGEKKSATVRRLGTCTSPLAFW